MQGFCQDIVKRSCEEEYDLNYCVAGGEVAVSGGEKAYGKNQMLNRTTEELLWRTPRMQRPGDRTTGRFVDSVESE